MESKLTNDRLIASHRNRPDLLPCPVNTLQFAYQDRRYQKMTLQTWTESDILKKKTLEEINNDLRRADFTNLMILSSDLCSVIIKLFQHQDDDIRELSSRAISEVCNTELGRNLIMESAFIHDIILLIDDQVTQIRQNAYQAMLNLTLYQEGQDHFLLSENIPPLVDKLVDEKDENILIFVLNLIKQILNAEGSTDSILQCNEVIERLTSLISHSNPTIRELSIKNLAQISFLDIGKAQQIEKKCVLELCKRLEDAQSNVREAATIALASLAQKNEAKEQILQYSYFQRIMELLYDPSEQTRLNIVQLIASLSEDPLGRKKAQSCLDHLTMILSDVDCVFLHPYIEATIEVIKWKP